MCDAETQRSRGFGYVWFAVKEDAVTAIEKLNGTKLAGRTVSVSLSNSREAKSERSKAVPAQDEMQVDDEAADSSEDGSGSSDSDGSDGSDDSDDSDDGTDSESSAADDESSSGDEESSDEEESSEASGDSGEKDVEPEATATKATPAPAPVAKPQTSSAAQIEGDLNKYRGRGVFLQELAEGTTQKHVYKRCRKLGSVEKIIMPGHGDDASTALVIYSNYRVILDFFC